MQFSTNDYSMDDDVIPGIASYKVTCKDNIITRTRYNDPSCQSLNSTLVRKSGCYLSQTQKKSLQYMCTSPIKMKKKRPIEGLIALGSLIAVLLLAGAFWYYYNQYRSKKPVIDMTRSALAHRVSVTQEGVESVNPLQRDANRIQ